MALKIITSKSNPKAIIDTARDLYRQRPSDGKDYSDAGVILKEGSNGEQAYVVFPSTFHKALADKGFKLCKQGSKERMEGSANLKRALTTAQKTVKAFLLHHQLSADEISDRMAALSASCINFISEPDAAGTDWKKSKDSLLSWLDE